MKLKLLIILVLCSTFLFAKDIKGDWKGMLKVGEIELPIVFHFAEKAGKLVATMDSPAQGAKAIPIDSAVFRNDSILLFAPNLGITYKGKLVKEIIEGTFNQMGRDFPLRMKRYEEEQTLLQRPQEPKPPFPYATEEVVVSNKEQGNRLAGTLCIPKGKEKFPIVVMITGSGTQNRDEEIFGHKPFAVLADYLARNGIGSLRMDDRGIGGSDKGKANPTTADFATDIQSAVNFISEKGYENIGLLGHSEGGMIAPIVGSKTEKVKFLVLLAAPGVSCSELLVSQNEAIGKAQGLSETLLQESKASNQELYAFIKNYKGNDLEEEVTHLLKKQLEKAYKTTLSTEKITPLAQKQARTMSSNWFQYFIRFEPEQYLEQLKIPVLALNGTLDLQVAAKENLQGIEMALQKAGNQHYTIKEFEGLNHLFQHAKSGLPSEYGQLTETISPDVLVYISEWINELP